MALLRDPNILDPRLADPLDVRWSPRAFDDQHELTSTQLHVLGIAIGVAASPDVLDERTREKEVLPRSRRPLGEFVFTGTCGTTPLDFD